MVRTAHIQANRVNYGKEIAHPINGSLIYLLRYFGLIQMYLETPTDNKRQKEICRMIPLHSLEAENVSDFCIHLVMSLFLKNKNTFEVLEYKACELYF